MRGLMQKDFELLRGNVKVFAGIYMISIFLLVTSGKDNAGFFVTYVTMISGILVLNTISYDDMDNGMRFLFTLPVTRKQYVQEKYVFGIMAGLGGWFTALAIGTVWTITRNPALDIQVWLLGCIPGIFVIIFLLTAMIPLQLKFGSENSRLVMIIVMVGCAGIVAGTLAVLKMLGVDLADMFMKINSLGLPVIGLIVLLICAACLFISSRVSIRILENKEF